MKRAFIISFLVALLPHLVWAQYYIILDKTNTFRYRNSYLIDIPLNVDEYNANLFVQDPDNLIPEKAYSTIEGREVNKLDTIFISHKKQIGIIGLRREILEKSLTEYLINNGYDIHNKDTLLDIDDRFSQYEQLFIKNKVGSVLIYYSENFGLGCCFPDSVVKAHDQYEKKYSLRDFIQRFEKKHHVKIGDIFSSSGDEGDGTEYLTLSGLTSKQKLQFLDERNNMLPSDGAIKTTKSQIAIYTPYYVSTYGFNRFGVKDSTKLKILEEDMVYTAVEKEPTYPGGLDAFIALLKNINFGQYTTIPIRFVVLKDGTITDIKVLRGGNKKINEQLINVLNKSLKWNPGLQNGKKVNVEYVISLANNDIKQ